jgi:hypothetical protein
MQIAGTGSGMEIVRLVQTTQEIKKLLELQGEMVVKLIESSRVPGPGDMSVASGLGTVIDIHA